MNRPTVNRIRPLRIPLMWVNPKGHKKHIGYYMPHADQIYTPRGNFSINLRQVCRKPNRPVTEPKNLMHLRRMVAAYESEDYTYRGK